ncbi:nitroreductase family deazaflavin-dependent oxidoreductase [Streptomyces bauhiniae]|uniref:nitroreductase family deazaflavin-dependent oxidoreductase n=1 Tax=Streptomyces bauhiniae TaxID=2340725 RepID=UPI003323194A
MRTAMVPVDRFLLTRSAGRYSSIGNTTAFALLLTTTGRRSGTQRSTPVFYKPYGDAVVVVASNFGRREHPAWSGNLLADPRATVTLGSRSYPVTARLLTGAEHQRVWKEFTQFASVYQNYLDTSHRTFRIFSLEPLESE